MSNLAIKVNLLRIKGTSLVNLKSKTGVTKECVIIPVEDCGLFKGEKGVYLDLTALAYREPMYNQTHFIKQSIDKDMYTSLSEEERNNLPIIGSVKAIERKQVQAEGYTDYEEVGADGLPF